MVKQEHVKYVCSKCGHIEKKTFLERLAFTIYHMIILAGVTGFAFIVFLVIFSHSGIGELLPVYVQTLKYNSAYETNFDLKIAVAPSVKPCLNDEDCIIIRMAEYLRNKTSYVNQGENMEQDPMTTLQIGGGNCEDLSILAAGALRQFGVKAFINCKIKYNHCIVTAYPAGADYYYIIDLTKDVSFVEKVDAGFDPWTFYKLDVKIVE